MYGPVKDALRQFATMWYSAEFSQMDYGTADTPYLGLIKPARERDQIQSIAVDMYSVRTNNWLT